MYVTENSMGLCIVLENTGDIAKCLMAFEEYNNEWKPTRPKEKWVPNKVLEALEEEISP